MDVNPADAQANDEMDAFISRMAHEPYDVALFGSSFRAYPPAVTGGLGVMIEPEAFCGACGDPLDGDRAEVCWAEGAELLPGLFVEDLAPQASFVIHASCYDPERMVIA